ncbi:hypothetical protein HOA92_00230 [archaeon]|jgi:uncharacterized protein|nr:hypothetical protein [archaeon]MBT6761446.1 hypothetical protein [archaeon]
MTDMIQELIEELGKSTAYTEEFDSEVKVIQTAISVVFLAGNFAYKISKPVDFGFLDFTTLEKRKECYDKEVSFNSMISPELYKGVVPILVNESGKISVAVDSNTSGNIVEYAIKMKRCDPNNVMKELLKSDKVSSEQIVEMAKIIAEFHQKAPISEEISNYGKREIILENWVENFEQTQGAKGLMISSSNFEYVKEKIETFLDENSELISKRVHSGKIKHCHGDLHSGNVFIEKDEQGNDKIMVFDGIVFNKRFPNSDTIADLAFMVMDLLFNGKEEFSKLLISNYQKVINDEDMDKLMAFYICYRAYVKGKINFFMYSDPNMPEESKSEILAEGKKYFELAVEYAEKV